MGGLRRADEAEAVSAYEQEVTGGSRLRSSGRDPSQLRLLLGAARQPAGAAVGNPERSGHRPLPTGCRKGGGLPSLEMWSNALRALDVDGVERRRLPVSLRLSKRAVRANLVAAARRGWAEEVPAGPAGRGTVTVRLSAGGAEVAARWEPLPGAAETAWGAQVGSHEADELRRALEDLVPGSRWNILTTPLATGPPMRPSPVATGGTGRPCTATAGARWHPCPCRHWCPRPSRPLPWPMSNRQAWPCRSAPWSCGEYRRRVALSATSAGPRACRPWSGTATCGAAGLDRAVGAADRRGRLVSDSYERRVDQVERDWGALYGQQVVGAVRHGLEGLRGDGDLTPA